MIETLDALRPEHLRLLHVIATTNEAPPELLYGSGDVTFAWKMPDVDTGEIHRLWGELSRLGVAGAYRQRSWRHSRPGNLSGRLTPYGKEFVEDAPPRGGLRKLARSPAGPGNRSDAVRSRSANRRAGECRPRVRLRAARRGERWRRVPRRGMASAAPAGGRASRGSATAGA